MRYQPGPGRFWLLFDRRKVAGRYTSDQPRHDAQRVSIVGQGPTIIDRIGHRCWIVPAVDESSPVPRFPGFDPLGVWDAREQRQVEFPQTSQVMHGDWPPEGVDATGAPRHPW